VAMLCSNVHWGVLQLLGLLVVILALSNQNPNQI
jgi:hypothetical protein